MVSNKSFLSAPLSLIFFVPLSVHARSVVKITFADKLNSPWSVDRPEEFLSQRSLERRSRFGISIAENDLPVSPSYLNAIRNMKGTKILQVTKWFNAAIVEVEDENQLVTIRNLQCVKSAEIIKKTLKCKVPDENEIRANAQRLVVETEEIYGISWRQVSMLGTHKLHSFGLDGAGVWIAVLDAGFPGIYDLKAFKFMRDNGRLLGYFDFVNNDTVQWDDYNSHGTLVLSCMATLLPEEYIGTAPGASYWLLRTEDADSETISEEYNWVAAAEFADSVGIDVINSSLGYTTFDDSTFNHTYIDMDGNTTIITIAADLAVSKGILVVNSAGNSGASDWQFIGAPADGDSVLAAGGVDENGNYVSFSSKGPTADGRIKPDLSAMAYLTWLVWPDGFIGQGNGTSFSAPLLAGSAATLIQAFPLKPPMEIQAGMKLCASQSMNPDTLTGWGIPDMYCSYKSMGGSSGTFEESRLLKLYPNPFSDLFNVYVYYPEDEIITVELHDLAGTILYSGKVAVSGNVISIIYFSDDLDDLPNGMYILSLESKHGIMRRKVLKQLR